jgi:hypothetical protein
MAFKLFLNFIFSQKMNIFSQAFPPYIKLLIRLNYKYCRSQKTGKEREEKIVRSFKTMQGRRR